VDKFNGDGIMAVFDRTDMVAQCCRCAQSIMAEACGHNPEEDTLPIGIGIHTGRVMIGNIGSPEHLDYSIIGPTVNLAKRLSCRARCGRRLGRAKIWYSWSHGKCTCAGLASVYRFTVWWWGRPASAAVRPRAPGSPRAFSRQNSTDSRITPRATRPDFHLTSEPDLRTRDLPVERDNPIPIRTRDLERHSVPFEAAEVDRDSHAISSLPHVARHSVPIHL
jgi:hypothetical protein